MPWDGTRLVVCRNCRRRRPARRAPGRGRRSGVDRPAGVVAGRPLYFVSDRSGWWNLYRRRRTAPIAVCPMSAEFAGPAWAFGMRWYAFLDPDTILACFSEDGRGHLGTHRRRRGHARSARLCPTPSSRGSPSSDGRAILRAGRPDGPAAIILLDPASGGVTRAVHRGRPAGRPALSGAAGGDRLSRARTARSPMPSTIRRPTPISARRRASCRR